MFKWVCLLVAIAALSAFGWMLNDVRLRIKDLTEIADKQLPPLLTEARRVTDQLDRHLPKLLTQTDQAATTINDQMPKLLVQSEQAAATINGHLPKLLTQVEQATTTINSQLPRLLASSETAIDNIGELSDNFKQYKGLMGMVHVATQNKDLFSYGSGILNWVREQNVTIGVKKPGPDQGLKLPAAAKDWADAARKDVHFLSLASASKGDLLHGLAKTNSAGALHVQVGDQAPRPLAGWVRENHAESKDVK
jgi:hypothetical protein